MAKAKKGAARPKPRKTSAPQIIALHNFNDLLHIAAKPTPTLAGDCLRNCLPARAFTLLSQIGEVLTDGGPGGDRVVNVERATKVAKLLAETFGYDEAEMFDRIKSAVADWNAANKDESGFPVPFI
jgi:hypothetical protein